MSDERGYQDEYHQLVANQSIQYTIEPTYVGYIQQYFPERGTATVINIVNAQPDFSGDGNDQVDPVVTQEMPIVTCLSSVCSGANPINPAAYPYGIQITPVGGGT